MEMVEADVTGSRSNFVSLYVKNGVEVSISSPSILLSGCCGWEGHGCRIPTPSAEVKYKRGCSVARDTLALFCRTGVLLNDNERYLLISSPSFYRYFIRLPGNVTQSEVLKSRDTTVSP